MSKRYLALFFSFLYALLADAQEIQRMEYFFNADPGFGAAIPLDITQADRISTAFTLSTNELESGMHQLFIRVRDEQGNWSMTSSRIFFIDPIPAANLHLQSLEYFIDADPGFGNGTPINVENQSTIALDLTGDLSDRNLDFGFHQLYIRALDNQGRWSHTTKRIFYLQPGTPGLARITRLEYYLTSGEYVSGLRQYLIPEPATTVDLDFQADLSFLPSENNQYQMSIYAVNESGARSLVETRPVNICDGEPAKAGFEFAIGEGRIDLSNTSTSADTFQWIIGEEIVEEKDHFFEFEGPGRYPVSLVAANICNQDTLSQVIEVPGLLDVFPNTGSIQQKEANLTITGFGLDSLPQVMLEDEGGNTYFPVSMVRADTMRLRAVFDFSQMPLGAYTVQVANESSGDTLSLGTSFTLLEGGTIPYDQWVEFELAPDSTFRESVLIPESEKLLVTMKKADRIGYSGTWRGELSLYLGEELVGKAQGSPDFDLELKKPLSTLYSIEVPNITSRPITGKVKVSFAPDWLPLNEWATGEILRPYGYDWKYVDIDANVDTLFFETEGYGLWSTIEVFQESLSEPIESWSFSNMGAGYAIKGHILSPDAGRYYIRYKDSAVLQKTENGNQVRDYLIYAGVSSAKGIDVENRSIEALSQYEMGRGKNTIELSGRGFSEQDSIVLMNMVDSTYYGMHTVFQSGNRLVAHQDFGQLPAGEYLLGIYGAPIQFHEQPLIIKQEVKQEVKVELIARDQFRIGRYQKFVVRLTNLGNVDKNFLSLFVSGIPAAAKIRFDSEISTIDESIYPRDSLSQFEIIEEEMVVPLFVNNLPAGESIDIEMSIYLSKMQDFELQVAVDELFEEKLDALSNEGLGEYIQMVYELDSLFEVVNELESQSPNTRRNDLIADAIKSSYGLIFEKINELANSPISKECSQELGKSFGTLLAMYTKENRDKIINQVKDGVMDFFFGGWGDCISKSTSTLKNNIWDPISRNRGTGIWNTTKKVFFQHDLYSNIFHSGLNCANAVLTTPITPSGLALKLTGKAIGKVSTNALYRMTVRRKQLDDRIKGRLFEISIAKDLMDAGEKFQNNVFNSIGSGFESGIGIGYGCQQELSNALKFIQGISSVTPEDKYGPTGFDQETDGDLANRKRFIPQGQLFEYKIDYWNKEDATAPAAEVFIRDTLETNFDIGTVNFTEIGFLGWKVPIEGGQYFNVTVDMRPEKELLVNVEGTVNPETREIYWVHRSLDPETMELPEDPTAGYLPPIDSTGYNIGWVMFTVEGLDSLGHNSTFQNQAHVNFDGVGPWGPAPPYGPYTNTIDQVAPESNVMALPVRSGPEFTVQWIGSDEGGGIGTYDIFVREDAGDFEPWLIATSLQEAAFTGDMGHTYAFYSVATDHTGNHEIKTDTTEAVTYVPELPGMTRLVSPLEYVVSADKFIWMTADEADSYTLQIAADSLFEDILIEETLSDTTMTTGQVEAKKPYYWRVMASNVSGDGDWTETGIFEVDMVTSLESTDSRNPENYSFGNLYPNPSEGVIFFKFAIPERIKVRIELFGVSGRSERVLIDRELGAGSYQLRSDLRMEASGMYVIQMQAGTFTQAYRLIISK
ncbi:T9SS type A sorting domain-containing protein [Cyclobacterium plantarum]|uniref:T9SS type A sorting domain-containing protein n=1 Tax=Cyclobacterium plantarum TaxID=2716263 RepID=A0ABX0H976_9BACT|nr:T9SS type A sorting domain-containing protein [Cyclobacterium plantarum]NHE56776.1 T9SS type A sorting domain-containing protein [Cyclobacterium plantarum]